MSPATRIPPASPTTTYAATRGAIATTSCAPSMRTSPTTSSCASRSPGDEIDAANPEMLIATGFLRMGPWELTAMEVAKIARQRFLDDVTNSVGETFLAHSLQCARCHDHKFDPVPTRDYYGIQAVFATTQLAEREAPFLPAENTGGFAEKRYLEMSQADHLATLAMLDEKSLKAAETWFTDKKIDPAQWQAALERAPANAPAPARLPLQHRAQSAAEAGRAGGPVPSPHARLDARGNRFRADRQQRPGAPLVGAGALRAICALGLRRTHAAGHEHLPTGAHGRASDDRRRTRGTLYPPWRRSLFARAPRCHRAS
ncbi:MAG: DUF1549 domain-containing protein [Chthoniobacter sp.]